MGRITRSSARRSSGVMRAINGTRARTAMANASSARADTSGHPAVPCQAYRLPAVEEAYREAALQHHLAQRPGCRCSLRLRHVRPLVAQLVQAGGEPANGLLRAGG